MSNDGGPAFPFDSFVDWKKSADDEVRLHDGSTGMTLRDYFAAHALTGLLASLDPDRDWTFERVVADATRIADVMLRERAK